jgi:hypothetical protein
MISLFASGCVTFPNAHLQHGVLESNDFIIPGTHFVHVLSRHSSNVVSVGLHGGEETAIPNPRLHIHTCSVTGEGTPTLASAEYSEIGSHGVQSGYRPMFPSAQKQTM